jgi:CDP-glycerol glycerophosphotransferase
MPRRRGLGELARAGYRRVPDSARSRISSRRRRLANRLHETALGRLSVVMPVYNVEGYLVEAVESVLSQSHRNLELILVDDGSTDTSGAMCDDFAKQDTRVRVIHKKNAGLGAARNTGIAAARGKYLAFIDSDDYVLPGAYEAMINSLRKSGSDVVTGNVRRRQGKREYQAWNQSRSHLVRRTGIALKDNPELVFDTVAWNKVFRRKFWNDNVKIFPVDKLYEDIVPIFTAFMRAKSIDVLPRAVYVWRLRDERDSITQRLLEPVNIRDRFEMIDTVESLLRDNQVGEVVADRLTLKILEGDLWIYVRDLAAAAEETVGLIQRVVKHYWPNASDRAIALIPAERRIAYWLLDHDRVADVSLFRTWYASVQANPPLATREGRLVLDTTDSPTSLTDIPAKDLDMGSAAETVANVTSVRWSAPTRVTVTGYAYTKYVSDGSQDITLIATSATTAESIVLPVERIESVEAAVWAADHSSPHDRDGFECVLDVPTLRASTGTDIDEWSFAVRVTDGTVERTIELTKIWRSGSAAVVGSSVLPDGTLASVKVDKGMPLRVRLEPARVLATAFDVEESTLTIRLTDARAVGSLLLASDTELGNIVATPAADGSFVAQLPPPGDPDLVITWRALAVVSGKRVPVLAPPGFRSGASPNAVGLRMVVTRSGRAVVQSRLNVATLDEVGITATGDISLVGALFALDAVEIGIGAGFGAPEVWHPAIVRDGRFEVSIPTTRADFAGVHRPLPTGRYRLHARRPGAPHEAALILSDHTAALFPAKHFTESLKIKFERGASSVLVAELAAPVPDEVLGRYAVRQLIERYSENPRELEEAVFFTVDLGANAGDSALALHQELRRRGLPLTLYWGVVDLSVPVPEGGIAVLKGSEQWFEKVNRSKFIVNNYGAIWGLSKNSGQRYLQTWHGTPLKLIGVSHARHLNAPNSTLDQIAMEAAEWDAFVSPSPYFSSLVPTEFFFNGPILETGYPRNDRLAVASSVDQDNIREALGIAEFAKVLLYAPTYREGQRHGWKAALYDGLDLARLAASLGPDWCILLRGHSFNARDDHSDRSMGQIVDVTRHPDVNDLYIASDVLVTDYSSVMFDYSVTGRPMAFFAPDVKKYVAARGVYFDLEQSAPGPLYTDVTQLATGLADLDELASAHKQQYAEFRERFAPWDDGQAARRVVDQFFT